MSVEVSYDYSPVPTKCVVHAVSYFLVRWVEVGVSGISGWDVYIVKSQFFLSREVDKNILNFGISGVDICWNLVVRENYITFYVGDESSPVGVGSVSSYRSEIRDVGGLCASL